MSKSKMFNKIKSYYDKGLWSEVRVYNMITKGVITDEEYQLIVNEHYKSIDVI